MNTSKLFIVLLLACACSVSLAQKDKKDNQKDKKGLDSFGDAAPTMGDIVGPLGAIPDPLSLGASPPGLSGDANTIPPFNMLRSDVSVSPNIANRGVPSLSLNIDRRIKQAEDLLNRMVWQLNRETSWANSVHDIIQNYQYKYSKVLSNIKKHSTSTQKMRSLLAELKQARLHEVLEQHLQMATEELSELSTVGGAGQDTSTYSSLKDRAALIKQDLEKMSHKKINKVLHGVQEKIKQAAADSVPPPSTDALKGLSLSGDKKKF